jgi:DUF971 family protein
MDIPDVEPPTSIELDRAHHLTLEWPDGATTRFALDDLRRNCPCAECRGKREQHELVGPAPGGPPVQAADAHLVGGWGLSITWSDGHDTGIFAWSMLRAWAGLDQSEHDDPDDGDPDNGVPENGAPENDAP